MDEDPIGEGLTNAIWTTDRGTVVKYIAGSSWTVVLMNILQVLFLNFEFLTKERRLHNEIRAKEVLADLGIPHPAIVRYDANFIEMDRIDGESMLSYLETASPRRCYELGTRKGEELDKLHEHGSAYVDCRCGNTMVAGEELVSVDHELFCEDASVFLRELDLITLMATAKVLPQENYAMFMQGLETGYSGLFRIDKSFRMLFIVVGMLGHAIIVKRSPRLALRTWKNWRRDLDQHVQQLPV